MRIIIGLLMAFFMNDTLAHIKWFAPYNIEKPPLPIEQVLTKPFIYLFLSSVFLVYLFFLVDRYICKQGYFSALDTRLRALNKFSMYLMRLSTGVFFISLWAFEQTHDVIFLLTPELKTNQVIIPWIHLCLGLCTLSRYTLPLIGFGILGLYAESIYLYGLYHLLDYVLFLGVSYFFIIINTNNATWRKSGFIVLFASLGLSLLWVSVEKFAYPVWSYPLLTEHSELLLGMSPSFFMIVAGFVEFNLTFLLLSAGSILIRFIAFGFENIFVLAIYKFGVIDALGHLLIITTLIILFVQGPTDARNMLILKEKSVWVEAYFMTGLFVLAFVMFFIMYYGFHYVAYGEMN